jgi:hypothetical protein
MQVRVYKNLHTKTYSVQTKTAKGWRVLDHRTFVILKDVKFVVQEGGRQRVIREKRKNVHAYAQGELVIKARIAVGQKLSYNPYKAGTFTTTEDEPVYSADCVYLSNHGIYTASINKPLTRLLG